MNVSLTSHLEEFVRERVDSGRYSSSSEVVREGLRLLEQRDIEQQARLAELRRAIQEGLDSGLAGPLDFDAIKAEGRRILSQRSGRGRSRENE